MAPRIIDRGRGPEIEGTRVTVYRIMDFICEGSPTDGICQELDLTADQVRVGLEYIEAHRSEVEAEYEKILDRVHGPNAARAEAGRARNAQELKQRILAGHSDRLTHAGRGGQ